MTATELAKGIIANATDYVGMVETRDNERWNKPERSDKLLRMMKRVRWWEPGAAYCAAFAGAVVIETLEEAGIDPSGFRKEWTAHCMTNVRRMRQLGILRQDAAIGGIALARHGASDRGHAWIVSDIGKRSQSTIEGNTMSGNAGDQRQGDGIYARVRDNKKNGSLVTQGYLCPQGMLSLCGLLVPDGFVAGPPVALTPAKPETPMIPIYGALDDAGLIDRLQQALKEIPGSKYDASAGFTVAPAAAVAEWIRKRQF
jgi:hypothetical protein